MKYEDTPQLEVMNPKTDEFEPLDPMLSDKAWRIISVFTAEEKVMERTVKTHKWMSGEEGLYHIEYN